MGLFGFKSAKKKAEEAARKAEAEKKAAEAKYAELQAKMNAAEAARKAAEEARKAAEDAKRAAEARRPAPDPEAAAAEAERRAEQTARAAVGFSGVHKATRLIQETLESKGMKNVRVEVRDHISFVKVGFQGKVAPGKDFFYISSDEDNDVTVRSETIAHVPEDKIAQVLRVTNEAHRKYRFSKYFLDKDGDLQIQADIPQETGDAAVGPVAFEYLIRMVTFLDDTYPDIMKALWN